MSVFYGLMCLVCIWATNAFWEHPDRGWRVTYGIAAIAWAVAFAAEVAK